MSAWYSTALTSFVSLLEADERLSTYVDAFVVTTKLRDDAAPAFTRHAIEIAPGGLSSDPAVTSANDETFTLELRLWLACWTTDTTSAGALALLTANDTGAGLGSGGTGGSQVGLLQFLEDVGNAVRKATLSGLVSPTAFELPAWSSIARATANDDRDRVFLFHDVTVSLLRRASHDPDLR